MERDATLARSDQAQNPLKNLRLLRVAVCHPDDGDGQQLTQQLRRIGCNVQAFWPPLPELPDLIDVVFLAVRPDTLDMHYEWLTADDGPTVIAVVNYENPTIVGTVLRIEAKATLPSPVRSFGLLSVLVVARQMHAELKAQKRQVRKLSGKLQGARRIEEAKSILMRTRGINETKAYDLLREQAMSKRVSVEDFAATIVSAHEILSLGKY